MMQNKLWQLMSDNRAIRDGRRFAIEAKDSADEVTVYLYDVIVSSPLEAEFWGGIAAEQFVRDWNSITAKTIHLRINSPGGDVFAARAMEAAIRASSAYVICHVDGYAASAATIIAMACDTVEMGDGAMMMIHKSWSLAMGNADDMRSTADLLDKVDSTLASTYAKKTGKTCAEIMQLLSDETWMTAQEAVDLGFADAITEAPATKDSIAWNLGVLRQREAIGPAPRDASEIESGSDVSVVCPSCGDVLQLEVHSVVKLMTPEEAEQEDAAEENAAPADTNEQQAVANRSRYERRQRHFERVTA